MIWAIYFLSLLAITGVVFFALPLDVWTTVWTNCCDASGRPTRRYVIGEVRSLTRFFGQIFLFAGLLLGIALSGLILVDRLVPLPIAIDAAGQIELDSKRWKRNLSTSPDNVKAKYIGHHIASGGTKQSAQVTMRALWHLFPLIAVVSAAISILGLRLFSNGYQSAVRNFSRNESARELRRVRRHYLKGVDSQCDVIV